MIQIQDDNFNQSASAPTSTFTPSTNANAQPNNEAQIDDLLAELDRLSKNLEDKPVESAKMDATVTEPASEEPARVEPISEEPMAVEPTVTPQSDEKFNFDAFLSDLEKKIDQETSKDSSEKALDSSDVTNSLDMSSDFRKNRSSIDIDSQVDDALGDNLEKDNSSAMSNSEELKAQNIFEMLGLMNISDEEKNQFLDDLESMIWDDFVAHDLELLLTSEEYAGARQILDDASKELAQQKEDLIVYLEKLVPDLDEVLYDKALELKSEMMGERLAKMKEAVDEAVLATVKEAEDLISQNRWKSAVSLLNAAI